MLKLTNPVLVSFLTLVSLPLSSCSNNNEEDPDSGDSGSELEDQPAVDSSLFLVDGLVSEITEVECTLSDGTTSQCYSITTTSRPTDHATGPWCPTHITDDADAGGIWPEDGVAHDVDGGFIENLATFYDDPAWQMYSEDGSIHFTETQEECEGAARPDVDPALQNHCVQCLPEYLESDAEYSYLIPKQPVLADAAQDIRGNMGVAFNGVEFAMAAPTDAILGAYTLAPFDDCGGHINTAAGYHYHAVTSDCLTQIEQSDGHAAMIGYAMDGFAMHEMNAPGGDEPDDLDPCRGHADSIRGYHYHVSGAGENMIIGCWSGLTVAAGDDAGGPPDDQPGGPPE